MTLYKFSRWFAVSMIGFMVIVCAYEALHYYRLGTAESAAQAVAIVVTGAVTLIISGLMYAALRKF